MRGNGRVAVCGDATIDWFAEVVPKKTPPRGQEDTIENWQLREGLRLHKDAGGACLLRQMIDTGLASAKSPPQVCGYSRDDLFASSDHAIHSYADLKEVKLEARRGIFVERFRGFSGPKQGLKPLPLSGGDDGPADVLVIDDAGNGFRSMSPDRWPHSLQHAHAARLVILKMSAPLATGQVWDALKRPPPDGGKALRILVVSADDLRGKGLDISRRLSWERSALNFCRLLKRSKEGHWLHELASFGHLLVRFGLEGVMWVTTGESGLSAELAFDPKRAEDGFVLPGHMAGRTSAFVSGITASLLGDGGWPDSAKPAEVEAALRKAIVVGMHRAQSIAKYGLACRNGALVYPVSEVFADPSPPPTVRWWNVPQSEIDNECCAILTTRPPGAAPPSSLEEVARRIAINGETALGDLPTVSFGDLLLADKHSIEAYRSVANLFEEYLKRAKGGRPLSVAVFGPPGTGKSFGVKEIAKRIAGDQIVARPFNLAEFVDTRGLSGAFQAARDIALKGKVPLIFFDEFDTDLDGRPLGWLKYFLAPMQDGEFLDGTSVHPIGRAIFVFAGGTAHSYAEFSREKDRQLVHDGGDPDGTSSQRLQDFKLVKGPDFLSRLRGYVNIPGLNGSTRGEADADSSHLIRRAILLREFLKQKAPDLFRGAERHLAIDPPVLDAFLGAKEYFHGARSMEAIIDMSLLVGRRQFELSSLPPDWQLRLHVDPSFTQLIAQGR